MLLRPSSVSRRLRRPSSLLRFCAGFALAALVLDTLLLTSQLPSSHRSSSRRMPRNPHSPNQTVFIASVHQNSAPRLHATWSDAVVQLIGLLGPDNVYFSAVEHASSDGTIPELVQLEQRLDDLQVGNTIHLGRTAWDLEDEANGQPPPGAEAGWLWHPKHQRWALRRVPIDAQARNQALLPLRELLLEQGRSFDRVLWLDDNIVFRPEDAVALLQTRDGDYAAVCSVAQAGPSTHRLNALTLRDDNGHLPVSTHWPWLSSSTSRSAAWAGSPIPVRSCWGGIVAFDAQPFYDHDSPLKFRSVNDEVAALHLEASERCLIHAYNPLASSRGIWVEPSVQTALDCKEGCWKVARPLSRDTWLTAMRGVWSNRLGTWRRPRSGAETNPELPQVKGWAAARGDPRMDGDSAISCLMDEMQIIKRTKWTFKLSNAGS
ncbi:unnamed protein product [Clonostachys chloroleuca]|uniref:Glycosyltransferase family 69 protein n=1 Tax=Clonostachys chloroleuca TaxID=1926264 RepID=A0AA35MF61_9HYPO|nr:unnamed protein product [Clonostachys chloroleuca]